MKIAFIGCGDISEYHAHACIAAGFKIDAVCSRPESQRPYEFAERFDVPHVFTDASSLLSGWRGDALLIAVPPRSTISILREAVSLGIPILVEKPVAVKSVLLEPFLGRNLPVIVGYNRRFYRPVREMRSIIQNSVVPSIAHLILPETVSDPGGEAWRSNIMDRFMGNSVHAMDVLHYVFGSLTMDSCYPLHNDSGRLAGLAALLKAVRHPIFVQVSAVWNSPANVGLAIYQNGLKALLEPYETATVYKTMDRIEPTPENPLRRYVPRPEQVFSVEPVDERFKPGFVQQAVALRQLVRGSTPGDAATLEDAYRAVKLSEQLLASALKVN